MDTYFILSLIFTAFVLFTIPVYILLIFVLFTKRAELKSVFYRIYAIGGLVDLIAIVNNYLGTFLPSHGLFIDVYLWLGPTAGQVSIAIAWAGRICQGTTSTLLALNRATAIVVPLKYPNIWSLEKTTVIYLVQLIPGFLSGCALFFTKMKLVKETDSGYYTEFIDEHFRVLYYAYGFGVDTLFVIIIIICYILMIFVHHFRSHSKKQLNSKLVKNNMKREMEFFGIAISICFLEICYFIFLIYFFVLNTNFDTETFYFYYNLLQDSYSCLPSYLLIGFSPIIRRLLLEKLGYKNVKMRKTITVRPSTTTATH